MSDHHHHRGGGTSRQHLHSLMARRATPSIRTPLGNRIISPAAGPDHTDIRNFTIQEVNMNPITITDFNINSTILDDILSEIEIEPLLDQIPASLSDIIKENFNGFIRAGINTELLAPGKDTDRPELMQHQDGTDGTITVGVEPDRFLMPSGELIIERNAALNELADTEKFDPVSTINDANATFLKDIVAALLEVIRVRHQDEMAHFIDTEILPVVNDQLDRLVGECNAQLRDMERAAADAEERASVAATETNDSNHELEQNYESAMRELNELAIIMNKFEKALAELNDKQYFLQEEQLATCTVMEIDDESSKSLSMKIEMIGERIKLIQASIDNATSRIRTVLTQRCNVPEKVRAEFAITTIKEKLPEKLNGKPDPLVAEELISFINKLISTYPEQLWSIVPTLHRLINMDHTEIHKGDLWSPPALESAYAEVPYELQPYYASHNQRLFDVLTIMGSQTVQRAMSSFSTGDDDISQRRTSHAVQADGISVLAWHLHYHEQSGYQIRAELQNYLNYAHGAFVDKDPVIAVTTIRKKLREAERLGIKLEYDMSCRRIVEVIRRRDVSFVSPMQHWITCPDPSKQNDCICFMDPLLAEIERIARNVTDVMPNLTDKHHKQAAALFTQFSSSVTDETCPPAKPTNGNTKQWTCPVKGCKNIISKAKREQHLEKIKKAKANSKGRRVAQLLCDHHLTELKKNGSVEYENGFTRKWHERGDKSVSANVAESKDNKSEPSIEETIKKAVQDQLSQVAMELKSVVDDTQGNAEPEPEPESEPTEESFASMLAKAIVNRHK